MIKYLYYKFVLRIDTNILAVYVCILKNNLEIFSYLIGNKLARFAAIFHIFILFRCTR